METQPQSPPPEDRPNDASDDRPRRVKRSGRDPMVAGVAGGLGRYFDIDPIIFRIGFAISLFFGGLGAVLYGALWLFVPDHDGRPAISGRSRALTIAAVIVLVAIAAPIIGGLSSWHGPAW